MRKDDAAWQRFVKRQAVAIVDELFRIVGDDVLRPDGGLQGGEKGRREWDGVELH